MAEDGKVAVVTGSATGIGAAVALRLARLGVAVVVNYSKSAAEAARSVEACAEAGARTLLVQANVADDADCRRLVAETIDKFGRLDYLVNNAGVTVFAEHGDLERVNAADFRRIYDVNVIGAFQMIRAAAPHLKASGAGAVVNVSSLAGLAGIGSSVPYAASKGALNTLTLSLARALGPETRVNAVCPGLVQSRWLEEGLGPERYAGMVQQVRARTPLKAASTPEEIAEPIVWLLTGGQHVTGVLLSVDAGTHLGFG